MIALALLATAPQSEPATPGFTTPPPAITLAQPRRDTPIDPLVARLVIARLVELHLLDHPEDATDAAKVRDALRAFQQAAGLRATGVLDRVTLNTILP